MTKLYLHVGLHKTGTTYFQSQVIRRWRNIQRIRHVNVESFLKLDTERQAIASREGLSGSVLASRKEKTTALARLSRMFPDAHILISFRTHGSYLGAMYSQYLRYGGTLPVHEFFDLEDDAGLIRRDDLVFRHYIEAIETYWGRPPFVFVLPEFYENPQGLLDDLGAIVGGTPPCAAELPATKSNVSLGRRQAEVLRRANRLCGVSLHRDGSTRPYSLARRMGIDPPNLCQRWARIHRGPDILPQDLTSRIDAAYAEDWRFVLDRVRNRLHDAQLPKSGVRGTTPA